MRAMVTLAFITGIGDCGKPEVAVQVVDSGEVPDCGEEEDVPNAEAEAEAGPEDSAEDSGTKSEP